MDRQIVIARARPNDAPVLSEIALAAKRHWRYPERWMQTWRAALTITPEHIASEPVYLARNGAELAGFYGFLHHENELWLEHLWVLPAQMGRGVGRALIAHAKETAFAEGASLLRIEADPNAEEFYRQCGAVRTGERVSEVDGHVRVLPVMALRLR